jgi:hypothetical protein
VHRAERFHHAQVREGALDLLGEAVVVGVAEHEVVSLVEAPGIGDVEQRLAGEVVRARCSQRVERTVSLGGVDQQLTELSGLLDAAEARAIAGALNPFAQLRLVRAASAESDLAAPIQRAVGDRPADVARSDDPDPHLIPFVVVCIPSLRSDTR